MTPDSFIRIIAGDAPAATDEAIDGIVAILAVHEPTALGRATGLWAWKRLWESTHGKSRGGDRKSAAFRAGEKSNGKDFRLISSSKTNHLSFSFVAAERLSVSERLIRLDTKLAEDLGVDDIQQLWDTRHADDAASLRDFARRTRPQRDTLIAIFREQPTLSFSAALVEARMRAAPDTDEQTFQRFVALWAGAGAKVRRRIVDHIHKSAV